MHPSPNRWAKSPSSHVTLHLSTTHENGKPYAVMQQQLHFSNWRPILQPSRMEHQHNNEKNSTQSQHAHYNHIDSCKHLRWTAKESYVYMYNRNWNPVVDFYSNLVSGRIHLSSLFQPPKPTAPQFDDKAALFIHTDVDDDYDVRKKGGRWARPNYKIVVGYNGNSFDGWQKQPGLITVQGVVEAALGRFVDDRKLETLRNKGLPVEGTVVVAGRTDKGVTALNQVCSFYTWRTDVSTEDIADVIDAAVPGSLRVVSVAKVGRSFHPNFSAMWRRYLYIFPLCDVVSDDVCGLQEQSSDGEEIDFGIKPKIFSVGKVDRLLRQLEGKLLSYKMFARDTKASRNEGPPTECFMYHARATEAVLPYFRDNEKQETKVMCVELVANRFLRRMVRVLVATCIREAAAGADDDMLLKLMEATCRRATAPPAPPDGLCLVDVGYVEFDSGVCFIS